MAAIGISGTACGAWLADGAGAPVRPAILWNDGRAAGITRAWSCDGTMDRIFAVSGNVPFPGYTLSVLAWLAANEPESLDAASSLLWCKDWLRSKLTGISATDESEASYVPFDITARAWSEELFELAGVHPWRRLVPDLLPPMTTLPLMSEAASRTGLPVEHRSRSARRTSSPGSSVLGPPRWEATSRSWARAPTPPWSRPSRPGSRGTWAS